MTDWLGKKSPLSSKNNILKTIFTDPISKKVANVKSEQLYNDVVKSGRETVLESIK